jgi:hypothetical protein
MSVRAMIVALALAGVAGCAQSDTSQPPADRGSGAGSAPASASSADSSGPSVVDSSSDNVAASPQKAAAVNPTSAPVPRWREVTVPSGTRLRVKLVNGVASDTSHVEDPVRGTLAEPLVVDGTVAVALGAEVGGSVLEAQQSGRVKGRASVAIRFDHLQTGGESHTIETARIAREAQATKGEDATKIGIGAGAGALVGAIAGGKKGAAVGTAVGAGAGTGVVLATRGEEVRLPAGTVVITTLQAPLTIQVPVR